MSKVKALKLCTLSAALLFVFLLSPGVARSVEFSADMVITPKGDEPMTGKIYVKGDNVRQETAEEGETQIMIIRPDKKVTWMITPEEKVYMEMPYTAEDKTFEEWTAEKEKKSKLVGEETVSGLPCKKYESVEDGEKTYFWISPKFPFPIRVEDAEVIMEYKNIKEGSVADSLFDLPAGYQKMSMPVMPEGEEPK
jgi:outer membrane lipoprotein-sorting protein